MRFFFSFLSISPNFIAAQFCVPIVLRPWLWPSNYWINYWSGRSQAHKNMNEHGQAIGEKLNNFVNRASADGGEERETENKITISFILEHQNFNHNYHLTVICANSKWYNIFMMCIKSSIVQANSSHRQFLLFQFLFFVFFIFVCRKNRITTMNIVITIRCFNNVEKYLFSIFALWKPHRARIDTHFIIHEVIHILGPTENHGVKKTKSGETKCDINNEYVYHDWYHGYVAIITYEYIGVRWPIIHTFPYYAFPQTHGWDIRAG